jgi:hypothetical protein
VCSSDQLDAFFAACLVTTATTATCSAFAGAAANTACVACLASNASDDTWGPVVDNGRFFTLNVDGCMELVDPALGKSCAVADQAASACEDQACRASCPFDSSASPGARDAQQAAYDACTVQADAAGCATLAAAAACVDAERDGGAASVCVRGRTFREIYDAIAPLFCAPSAVDAGAGGG